MGRRALACEVRMWSDDGPNDYATRSHGIAAVETLRYGDTIAQLVTGGRHYRRGCRRNGGLAVNNIVVAIITLKVI